MQLLGVRQSTPPSTPSNFVPWTPSQTVSGGEPADKRGGISRGAGHKAKGTNIMTWMRMKVTIRPAFLARPRGIILANSAVVSWLQQSMQKIY